MPEAFKGSRAGGVQGLEGFEEFEMFEMFEGVAFGEVGSLGSGFQGFRVYPRGDRFRGSNAYCSNLIYLQNIIEHRKHRCYGFTQIKEKIRANPLYLRHPCSIAGS